MKRLLYLVMICACSSSFLLARHSTYRRARSTTDFYEYIRPGVRNELTLAAVLFYDGQVYKNIEDRSARNNMRKLVKEQENTFKRANRGFDDVFFISLDVSEHDNDSLIKAYAVDDHAFPFMLLFKNGKTFKTHKGARPLLAGDFEKKRILSVQAISRFIKQYLSADIQKIVHARAKAQLEIEKARARAPRVYAWGYPYWGGYPYGGWGWGYPYGGWGWRGGYWW